MQNQFIALPQIQQINQAKILNYHPEQKLNNFKQFQLPLLYQPRNYILNQPITKSLQVGFVQEEFLYQEPQIKYIQRPQAKQKKYYVEFPADYLEEIELPEEKQQKPNFRIIANPSNELTRSESQLKSNKIRSEQTIRSKFSTKSQIIFQQKKIEIHSKTKILQINLRFLNVYLRSIRNSIKNKQHQQQEELKTKGNQAIVKLSADINQLLSKSLVELMNNKLDCTLILGDQSENEKKRKMIEKLLTSMVLDLKKGIKLVDEGVQMLLVQLTESYRFPAQKYLLKFEVLRLPFTNFGSYGILNQEQQKMILIGLFLVRIICFKNILKTYQFYQNKNDQDQIQRIKNNSVIIVSILHEIISKWMMKMVPQLNDDADEIQKILQFNQLPLSGDPQNQILLEKQYPSHILIDDLLSTFQLNKYILNNQNVREVWINKIEGELIKFIDNIFNQMKSFTKQNKKERLIMILIRYQQEQKKKKQQIKQQK